MDIERANMVLRKAIIGLQEGEIGGFVDLTEQAEVPISLKEATVLAKKLETNIKRPIRKWWPRMHSSGEVRWDVKPKKGAIYVSREIRGTDSWQDGLIDRTIPVWKMGDGTYKIASDMPKIAKDHDFVTVFWQWWNWSVDD